MIYSKTLEFLGLDAAVTLGDSVEQFSVGKGYQSEIDIGDKGKIKAQLAISSGEVDAKNDATQIAVEYDDSFDEKTTIHIAYTIVKQASKASYKVDDKIQ